MVRHHSYNEPNDTPYGRSNWPQNRPARNSAYEESECACSEPSHDETSISDSSPEMNGKRRQRATEELIYSLDPYTDKATRLSFYQTIRQSDGLARSVAVTTGQADQYEH